MKSVLFSILCACLIAASAHAHDGEDHGVTPAMIGQALEPRFEARGSLAEVTGILSEGQLWVFASRIATSEPWSRLDVEVESGGRTMKATEKSPGVYRVEAAPVGQPGRHAITLTLRGEGLEELLTGELLTPARPAPPSLPYGWMAAALAALAGATLLYRRYAKR
jgi:hypothetical protein